MILVKNHPKEPMRKKDNFVNENLILSSLSFIVIKHILTKNLKKDDVLVIGRVFSLVEIFMLYFLLLSSKTVPGLCFEAEHSGFLLC